jgi:hypothetical protein
VHGGGYWEGQGVCIADDPESPWGTRGDLFGYVAGLLSTIGCLEGHNVKPVEVAAMREVCRVRGWEIPSEFSLNPPNSPAVLIHWRALIELLGLMPAPRREALCSLRFPVVSSRGSGSSGEPPAVNPWTGPMRGGPVEVQWGGYPLRGREDHHNLGDEGWWVSCTSASVSLQLEASAVSSSGRLE